MIVAGFGFRTGATCDSMRDALVRARAGLPCPQLQALAAPADKAPHLDALAKDLGLPIMPIEDAALREIDTPTRSLASLAARRTGSVAEAAALAAAGPNAVLLTARHISSDRMATCAIAQGVST